MAPYSWSCSDTHGRGNIVTEEEAKCAIGEVWKELLHTSDIQGETDFFAIGGDSLLGAMLIGSIADMAGVEMDIMDLFENPTLAQQVALVVKRDA
jgi:phthiocerol/phenolphthiocerol synthesis type-I polyketide synthase E